MLVFWCFSEKGKSQAKVWVTVVVYLARSVKVSD